MNAKEIATLAHAGQFRRDGVTPYITHPEKVAAFFEEGTLEWEIAWLHDVLEDTQLTSLGLADMGVSDYVRTHVRFLTHKKEVDYFQYIRKVASAPVARKIKIADIFANLSDSPTERQKQKYKKALKILLAKL